MPTISSASEEANQALNPVGRLQRLTNLRVGVGLVAPLPLCWQSGMLSLHRMPDRIPTLGTHMPRRNKPPPMRRIAEPDVVDDALLERVWYKPHE